MECRKCPYIREEVKRMVSEYYQYPGAYLPEDEIAEWLAEQRWCDKVGGKISRFGKCEDSYSELLKKTSHSRQKKRNKRERDQRHKNHLKFLAENIPRYPSPVIYTDEVRIRGKEYVENPKPYYKRLYRGRGKGMSYYHKKMSNKKIRKYKGELPKRGDSGHKLYDFWWELT